jgi:hypothetical protein
VLKLAADGAVSTELLLDKHWEKTLQPRAHNTFSRELAVKHWLHYLYIAVFSCIINVRQAALQLQHRAPVQRPPLAAQHAENQHEEIP